MNELKVLHRDIKNPNILLHFPKFQGRQEKAANSEYKLSNPEEVIVKLADFGFSIVLQKDELANK